MPNTYFSPVVDVVLAGTENSVSEDDETEDVTGLVVTTCTLEVLVVVLISVVVDGSGVIVLPLGSLVKLVSSIKNTWITNFVSMSSKNRSRSN